MELAELEQLRATLLADLDGFVRFFDKGGVDHERGGVCCGLSATGARLTGLKFVWFNGRGIWTYARLYNSGLLCEAATPRPESDSMQRYLLNVASGARNFALAHGRDANGGFVVEMDESGKPLKAAEPKYIPTSGYGSAFVAEGLTELFRATGRIDDADLAVQLLRAFVVLMDDPERPGDQGPWPACYPGLRTLGHHMICVSLARQLHEALSHAFSGRGSQGSGPSQPPLLTALPTAGPVPEVLVELEALLERVVQAVLGPFLHPTHGLLNECLAHDYSRPDDGNAHLSYLGHAIETLWMVMAEAERRGDEALLAPGASAGGGAEGAPVDAGMAAWAADTLRRTLSYMDGAFRLSQFGPGSWKVGGDRWVKPDPDPDTGVSGYNMGCKSLPNRVEHYHTPRMLMSCIASCDVAIAKLKK